MPKATPMQIATSRFEVLSFDDRYLGFVEENERGHWLAFTRGEYKIGEYATPMAARDAVVAWAARKYRRPSSAST